MPLMESLPLIEETLVIQTVELWKFQGTKIVRVLLLWAICQIIKIPFLFFFFLFLRTSSTLATAILFPNSIYFFWNNSNSRSLWNKKDTIKSLFPCLGAYLYSVIQSTVLSQLWIDPLWRNSKYVLHLLFSLFPFTPHKKIIQEILARVCWSVFF